MQRPSPYSLASMKPTFLRLLPVLAFALVSLHAADDPRLDQLRAADDERVAAVVAGDRARLTAIFSDDLRYAHSTGAVDDKTSYIEALATGRTKYLTWNYEERNFTMPAPGIALMTGRTRVKIGKAEGTTEMVLGFLSVWREEKGQWRFLSWQSCKMPEPVPAPK
jgi:ketosteroid isomerase-like protein